MSAASTRPARAPQGLGDLGPLLGRAASRAALGEIPPLMTPPGARWIAEGGVTSALGFSAGGVSCGLKKSGRPDLAVILSDRPATAAARYTSNRLRAAPIAVTRDHLRHASPRAVVVNSGNANACTGRQGLADARAMCAATALELGVEPHSVLVASTGVIGTPMPMDRILRGIPRVCAALSVGGAERAAEAILTTDRRRKQAALEMTGEELGGVRLGGMAKGSGMIHPNFATMLAFVTTDAGLTAEAADTALGEAVERSFSRISVDGDPSTNDMVLLLANGAAGSEQLSPGAPGWRAFVDALTRLCQQLARAIAADGEGATKLLEVTVEGARSERLAARLARAVVSSSLVKTAVHGGDPNWGRVLAAAGRSGVAFSPSRISLWLREVCLYRAGAPVAGGREAAALVLRGSVAPFRLVVGDGPGRATAWGCDLSNDYVTINSRYST